MKKNIAEKRKYIRAKRILSIRHRLHKRKGKLTENEWCLSTTEDMSMSGVLFITSQAYQVNDVIELQVVMAGALDIFNGYGKVVRVNKKDTGVVYLVAVEYQSTKTPLKRRAKSYCC